MVFCRQGDGGLGQFYLGFLFQRSNARINVERALPDLLLLLTNEPLALYSDTSGFPKKLKYENGCWYLVFG